MMALLAITTILGTFAGTLLALEAKAWAPHLSGRLLRAVIARLPAGLEEETSSRWAEEIESDLSSFDDRPLSGLLFALRLRFKGGRDLAAELSLEQTLSGNSVTRGADGEKPPVTSRILIDANVFSVLLRRYLDQQLDGMIKRQLVGAERRTLIAAALKQVVADPRVIANVSGDPVAQRRFLLMLVLLIAEGER